MLPKRIYAKINLDNIAKNIHTVRERIGNDVRIMGIVKADGYGHGAVETARLLSEIGVKDLGVATAGEAVSLHKNGIDSRILILGHTFPEDFPDVLAYNIDTAVFDLQNAEMLSKEAEKNSKKTGVYIKIDVGMGRLGFQPDKHGEEQIKKLFSLHGLNILGAFAHFPCADSADKTASEMQRQKFFDFTDKIIADGFPLPCRHIFNSAAAITLSGECGDLVRCGIVTYGLYPSEELKDICTLYPAMELKSSIAFVKDVPAGFTVSYGSTFITEKSTKIATVTAGYSDGYPRYLSNKGEVLVHGIRCPILGRVCMDQFMIDVTAVPDVKSGDEVTLVGTDGEESISIEDISDSDARFNYETVCLINKRVPRVYVKNGEVIKIEDWYTNNTYI